MIRCAGERRLDGLHPARGDEQRNAINDPESSDDADQACAQLTARERLRARGVCIWST